MAFVLCLGTIRTSFAAEIEEEEGKSKCPDKSQYTLFNPTPAECMREFDPDRPDITDSPFTIDAAFEVATLFGTQDPLGGIVTLDTGVLYKFGHDWQFDFGSNFGVTRASDRVNPFVGLSKRF